MTKLTKFVKIGALAVHPGWVQTDMGGKQAPLTAEVELYHHALSSPLSLKDATRNFKAISCCHLNKLLSDPIVDVHIFEAPVTQPPNYTHLCILTFSPGECERRARCG